ncbi:tRNA (cytidine(32)-2'-O)-methyltransferase non-catalytic subunit TRM732 [Cytospora mali]|uniref:tRNA (Cytidine(32)-2'-O)-methyltransferase non-catalytic subunit TRM732 n=1 Tax=Cytospora mali TaxID=578113 RepID=A0A194VN24_CYTMA|nr:tRNA (cytidine(32)-2'-O)-methyltransferase non-catalytic subunit TRM732 [Valsa mali]
MGNIELPSLQGLGSNANDLVAWVQDRPQEDLVRSAQELFEKLLNNASQPRSSTADACVKLCGFVQLCAKSKEESLRRWAFSEEIANDLLNFYIEWNEKDAHRSMRLVLDLLAMLMTQNPTTQVREAVKEDILSTLVSIIGRKSMRPLVKSCLSCLNHLLIKSVFTLEDVLRQYRTVRSDLSEKPDIILWQEWVAEVFRWMNLHYVCPVAGKLLVIIFSGLYKSSRKSENTKSAEFDVNTVRKWVETAISANPELLETTKNYLVVPLFKYDRALSIAFLEELNNRRPEEYTNSAELDVPALLHLSALEIGKKASVVDDPSPTGTKQPENVVVLNQEVLERFLIHSSHDVRASAMSLLTTSSSTTKPYSEMSFDLLRKHLKSCHADSDAKFRNEILGYSKNMVRRIKGAITTLERDISRQALKTSKNKTNGAPANTHISKGAKEILNAGEPWLRETLKSHEEFYSWYLQFLLQELVPTASYQRHITALKALVSVVKLGKETPSPAEQQIYEDPQWIRIIMDLIMDPFDDAREAATSLLMMYPPEAIQTEITIAKGLPPSTPLKLLGEFCSRAAGQASRTARADHSDGAARSHGLLCAWQSTFEQRVSLLSQTLDELELKIGRAEKDLGQAVMGEPVHGDFAAVRYIWEVLSLSRYSEDELKLLSVPQMRIVSLCSRIWDAVSYVLCDDSPEGHLPEELEEIEGLDTKGLLSYSFRAIHESSNLMRTIVGNLKFSRTAAGYLLPTPEVFSRAGNLAFSQLSKLRHRGAFSSVSLNFTCCCQHAQDPRVASSENENSLLEAWYKGALSCIHEQRSTTRRSAGLPALITGLLASNADSPSFREVMRTLQGIAQKPARVSETDGSNLPQVHAFNCLKEVFKSSLLSKKSELYLPECLQLATNSLKAEVWAIRNCALLLLRSLMDNLFGTNETKSSMESGWDGKTLRISYTKYSSLPPILLNLLQSGQQAMEPGTLTQSSAAESVFPALDIIRRAGPPESHRDELYTLIATYLGSRQWHVREIAARTLCSFFMNEEWLSSIQRLLEESRSSANRMHGTLLTIKFFLERKYANDFKELKITLGAFEQDALMCSETWAAYTEVLNLTWELDSSEREEPTESAMSANFLNRQDSYPKGRPFASRALFDNRLGIKAMQDATRARDLEALKVCLHDSLANDTDTACALVEAIPSIWGEERVPELCLLYLEVCKFSKVPEARAAALTNLAELMDDCITKGQIKELPSPEELDPFQLFLQDSINPALANAILLASGPIMTIQALKHNGQMSFFMFEQKLRSWGKAMADALHDSNTFDMRMAAAMSLKSFATGLRTAVNTDAAYLPFLLALYNTLTDDDDEIRDVGSIAAAFITSDGAQQHPQPLVAVDTADALLAWAQQHFGRTNEFRAYATCRLVGDPIVAIDIGVQDLSAWTAPEQQFTAALTVDESLFAVEEQNLFIDEVRETNRWAGIFKGFEWDFDELEGPDGSVKRTLIMDSSLTTLKAWAEKALEVLAGQVQEDDGPLGWASRAEAFALCHRVLVCGKVLAEVLGEDQGTTIAGLLSRAGEVGRGSRLHGLLLSTLD